jgi:hypothetical protein
MIYYLSLAATQDSLVPRDGFESAFRYNQEPKLWNAKQPLECTVAGFHICRDWFDAIVKRPRFGRYSLGYMIQLDCTG